MEIISNLMHMPTEVAKKALDNVPGYFEVCREGMQGVISIHKDGEEYSNANTKMIFDALKSRKALLEASYQEAKTQEEKDFYLEKIAEVEQEQKDEVARIEKERSERQKETVKALIVLVSLAGAAIGVGVRIGKKK